ncbi:MAG: T9SS type A sorting domain-containing protein, partial [Bacteroidetes bacterium]|nr:T9SS type A sorting domain-containing protein [Bacteroidota bacterium]
VATATVVFNHTDADTLPVDVTGANWTSYSSLSGVKLDGINPIVFDSDGSITDAMFGAGSSADIIGFAYSEDVDGDGYLDEGEAFMNGKFADGTTNSFTYDEWKSTFVHEFGHFLGLDHTQINGKFVGDSDKTIYIPTMYPTATINDVPLGDLNPDDIAAISLLYPAASFASTTGKISGTVTKANGSAVTGANIIAISTGADSLMNQISTVTDYYAYDSQIYTGGFTIEGIAPGSYYVRAEPIDKNFTGGSSVGPYAYDLTDLSFKNPIAPEYYNGVNESHDPAVDNPNEKTAVPVTAGTTSSGVNFIANQKAANGSANFVEDFTGNAGTVLLDAGWVLSGTATANSITIVSPGLTFSGYSSSGIGNAALLKTSGQDVYNSFDPISEGPVYLSFMMNVESAQTGDYFIALSPSDVQTNYFTRVHVKSSGSGYVVGISKFSEVSGGGKYGTTVLQFNQTYLVVVRYEFLSGSTTNDPIDVFVFSSSLPSAEPGTKEISSYTSAKTDAADLGIVTLRQGNSSAAPQLKIDGIRIGTTWPGTTTGIAERKNTLPAEFSLSQNYPNPFNPATVISYQVPEAGKVTLTVFDMLGREVNVLVNAEQAPGSYSVPFDASQLSSGIYLYQIKAGNFVQTKKMLLLK